MRGDAFIHFVCGSRLGVLLLILKSPQIIFVYISEGYKGKFYLGVAHILP